MKKIITAGCLLGLVLTSAFAGSCNKLKIVAQKEDGSIDYSSLPEFIASRVTCDTEALLDKADELYENPETFETAAAYELTALALNNTYTEIKFLDEYKIATYQEIQDFQENPFFNINLQNKLFNRLLEARRKEQQLKAE